ncbi:Synaptotagmin-13, partial [Frankliniella fusca]
RNGLVQILTCKFIKTKQAIGKEIKVSLIDCIKRITYIEMAQLTHYKRQKERQIKRCLGLKLHLKKKKRKEKKRKQNKRKQNKKETIWSETLMIK